MRTLFLGGTVHTPADPGATAVLVESGRIAWVGSEGAALAQRDGVDRVVDLAGTLLTPAFVDAHVHITATGMNLAGLDCTGTTSADDVLDRVRAHCSGLPAGDIVLGHGWDETTWANPHLPTREDLDRAAPGVPIYLTRIDVHSAIASSALLDLLPGVHAKQGFDASGVLRSDAHHDARGTVLDRIPARQRRDLHETALALFASRGIAGVHEMAGPDISSRTDLAELLAPDRAGPLVTAYWGELGGAETARELGAIGAGGDLFADGALGSHTAFLKQPYADDATTSGVSHVSAADVVEHVVDCDRVGVQAGFHVIGDGALEQVVEGFRRAAARLGPGRVRAGRHRLEHVEMPDASAMATIAELGLTASMQPAFDALWGGPAAMYAARLGRDRAAGMNPFRTLQRAGVALAFGSDTPVTAVDPWAAVAAAVFHRTESSRISARAAFNAHTRGGWRAIGCDDAGVILPGQRAALAVWEAGDLAVQAPDERVAGWSTDPRSGTPVLPVLAPEGPSPECLLTMLDGEVIFDAGRVG